MKKILVTGSNGFLGQKVVDLLAKNDQYDVVAISKGPNRNPNQVNYTFYQVDLSDREKLTDFLAAQTFDAIVHTAAMTSVEACEADQAACQSLNVDLVAYLASYCTTHQTQLVHLSTDFVFDGKKNTPYDETDLPNPQSEYGKSKYASEQVLAQSGCHYAILRTILVYGINADPNRSNLVLWAKSKLSQNEPIKVVNDQWRMPTFVDDLAYACQLAIDREAQGIFHISGAELMSINEAVYKIADFWQLDKGLISEISAASIGQAENRPRQTGFDLTRSNAELGYVPTSFTDALAIIDHQFKTFGR
ncbi:SDR family oxidoreductase [Sphingobacterium multivorum]|jgi:dTDP-4-dehydrorhamnose reductase|uniref:SDR family oxidoreductase n=1 Tax=Sphingobacterium multivorum TaxID=28454 RepID=UPI0028ACDEA4|nr:NAD(P)-dependent oxidoreductase [Sphingobacterium multivorum]MDF2853851.1 NAD(P)-dependent oxidoreductase [Sphingobacterium multivorum]